MNVQFCKNDRTDIVEWLKDKNKFDNQIETYLLPFDDKIYSPIYSYSANFQAKIKTLSFCSVDVQNAWLLKKDSSFNFYIVVKQNPKLVTLINREFGPHSIETDLEINQVTQPTAYHWDGEYNIIVRQFHNIVGDKRYDSFVLITVGNMKYEELIRIYNEKP